jgi:hypothetical protein
VLFSGRKKPTAVRIPYDENGIWKIWCGSYRATVVIKKERREKDD